MSSQTSQLANSERANDFLKASFLKALVLESSHVGGTKNNAEHTTRETESWRFKLFQQPNERLQGRNGIQVGNFFKTILTVIFREAINEEISDLDTTVLHESPNQIVDHLAELSRKLESIERSSKRTAFVSNLSLLLSISTVAFFVYKHQRL